VCAAAPRMHAASAHITITAAHLWKPPGGLPHTHVPHSPSPGATLRKQRLLTPVDVPCVPCVPYAAGVSFRKQRLLTLVDVQRHILRFGGVVTGMLIYPDFAAFFRANPRGVYKTPSGYPLETAYGHAIFCLGWNDVEEWWYCKNSWGPKFADNGFFRVTMLCSAPRAAATTATMTSMSTPACRLTPSLCTRLHALLSLSHRSHARRQAK
jgi:Papain family cysteine protease